MRAIVASHRFNPGHLSHLLANARMLGDAGYAVAFRWHRRFATMLSANDTPVPEALAGVLQMSRGDVYVLWFPSLVGFLDILLLRVLLRPVRVVYVFHEPYTSYRSYRTSGFSRLKTFKVYLIHLISSATVWFSDAVILPSKNALEAFTLRYGETGKSIQVVPLMFDDEAAVDVPALAERRFISYIGTVAEDHAFDRFVDFAEQAVKAGLVGGLRFLLATRSVLDAETERRLAPFVASGQMQIQSGRPLSNAEINAAFASSAVVWNAYRRSMQSGVLPKAYMFGTPVLVSDANTSEFFENGQHGVQVSTSYDPAELAAAVATITGDFERFSAACREAFFQHFHYRAHSASFLASLRGAPRPP